MSIEIIDFRSDTKTLPTKEMLKAMRSADLGDSKAGEDPTVERLETMAAERLGKERGMLLISGTISNLIAHMTFADQGDGIVIDTESHAAHYEGGFAAVAGLVPVTVTSDWGILDPADLEAAIDGARRWQPPRILHLENTHVMSGGRLVPLDLHRQHCRIARERGLAIHLDGARIFNAEAASGAPAAKFAETVDSVTFCLSKNLCCPLGSVLCGSGDFIDEAKRIRGFLGGGMRQAGVIAAAGIVALETMINRLKDDHQLAAHLARELDKLPGLSVDLDKVDTNMIKVSLAPGGPNPDDLVARLADNGVRISKYPPDYLRFVIHRHHSRTTVDQALERIRAALDQGC